MRILIVEDESKLCSYLQKILAAQHHTVTCCRTAEEALQGGYLPSCDLMILDLMLPGKSGEKFLEEIRKKGFESPVLVLTAKDMIASKVFVLEIGADDYLVKPFHIDELLARVKSLQRRAAQKPAQSYLESGDVRFYPKQNKVQRGDCDILLTKRESEVFGYLLAHPGEVVRTEDIMTRVWKFHGGFHSNIVQATIRRLRKKVDEGFQHKMIRNVHGLGYMVVIPEAQTKAKMALK